jgi:hypothetical protein
MTNATKAQIIVLINTGMSLLIAFGFSLSDAQTAAITSFVNAALGVWVGLTYTHSKLRKNEEERDGSKVPDNHLPEMGS